MPRQKSAESEALRDKQAQEAAYLKAQYHLSQEEIGTALNCSQSHVSQLLVRAGRKGWLKIEHRFDPTGLPEERLEEIRHRLEPQALTKALRQLRSENGVYVSNVRVFDESSAETLNGGYDELLRKFGRIAAGRVKELLHYAEIVGVTWGQTVSCITEGLAWLNAYPQEERVVKFVPVCAELTSRASIEFSSSRIADRLNEIINGRRGEQFSLTGVPAFIPRRLKDTLWEWIRDLDPYKIIFGGSSPMIETIDSLITSVGSSERPFGSTTELLKALLEAGRITANDLKRLIIGDIGGVLIPKPTLGSRELKLVEELNEMWTGIHLDHIKRIAKMASISKNRPGNIIVAAGEEKGLILYEVIRLGLVNELIIDKKLARSLEGVLRTVADQ